MAKCEEISENAKKFIEQSGIGKHGATGSRLLSGNHKLYHKLESFLCAHYTAEAALVFNSGYDANIGFFSSVPQKGDLIFYDELIHASIREGISMSYAKSYKFAHNDLESLKNKVKTIRSDASEGSECEVYVVTESVFSMDGDSPNLKSFADFCSKENFHLVVDEAHALGVFGKGLVDIVGISNAVFARILTFGKALGYHGSAILGSKPLKDYLVNFARSLIYTTAMPPDALAMILGSYSFLEEERSKRQEQLHSNIHFFKKEVRRLELSVRFLESESAIHCMLLPGNDNVKELSQMLEEKGYDVKPILSPTVKKGEERLRFCLHSYNSKEEITSLLSHIKEHLN
ncbi:MAG: aminotransferase class I/II-fold pyridoxal phosphate-dependent enzyme [Bacteroidota bacterium]